MLKIAISALMLLLVLVECNCNLFFNLVTMGSKRMSVVASLSNCASLWVTWFVLS